jgi:hypothetical protein
MADKDAGNETPPVELGHVGAVGDASFRDTRDVSEDRDRQMFSACHFHVVQRKDPPKPAGHHRVDPAFGRWLETS